jgi:hypothetical protein
MGMERPPNADRKDGAEYFIKYIHSARVGCLRMITSFPPKGSSCRPKAEAAPKPDVTIVIDLVLVAGELHVAEQRTLPSLDRSGFPSAGRGVGPNSCLAVILVSPNVARGIGTPTRKGAAALGKWSVIKCTKVPFFRFGNSGCRKSVVIGVYPNLDRL